jgi:hypothetical protein
MYGQADTLGWCWTFDFWIFATRSIENPGNFLA